MRTPFKTCQLFTLGLMCVLWLGCEEPKLTPEQVTPFVTEWSAQIGPTLKERAERSATASVLKAQLLDAQERESKKLKRDEPSYPALIEPLYAAREYQTAFIQKGELTPAGVAILERLERVEEDGFDPLPYELGAIRKELEDLKALMEKRATLGDISPGDAELAFIMARVLETKPGELALDESSYEGMNAMLLEDEAGAALREQLRRYEEADAQIATQQASIERRLALGIARYARNMRYFRVPEAFVHPRQDDTYNDPETRGKRPLEAQAAYQAGVTWRNAIFTAQAMGKKQTAPLLHGHITRLVARAMDAKDAPTLTSHLDTLSPGPQYDGLRAEHQRYLKIVAAGGWKELPETKGLKQGSRGAAVKDLKERLNIEGYLAEDKAAGELFDADLTDAVNAYQTTHQMTATGKPDRAFWRSLNVPAARRASQLALNMRRWRESNVQHHDHDVYVLINLPDFTAEIWEEKKRAMRMRVVIGNNDRELNEETDKMEFANRTPTLSAYIDRVIYNPFWNITPRIREKETLVDVRKDLEKVYAAKIDKLLALSATPKTAATTPGQVGGAASPTALQGGVVAASTTNAPSGARPYGNSADGWRLDIAAFQQAYRASHGGMEADIKALFPYIVPETGLVDVSTTDPNNIPPWYAKNGHEVMYPGKSWEYIRQLNGDANSLGRVKIIFPNLHDVYLHDTPHKALFSRDIRAYSHGCMRMHEPLEFAQWIMERDGQYDAARIKKLLADKAYTAFFLKRQIPVHIDYFTARVDDEGRANFLIDIYNRDDT